jgi:DNA-binding NtrC family response regulator
MSIASGMSQPARILLVEDELIQGGVLREQLAESGYRVDWTPNPREGMTLALEGAYDVVITDFQMPGMDGLELLERVRRQRPFLPVIIMTGYHTAETGIDAARLGAFEYLLKPYAMEDLLALVVRAVENKRTQEQVLEQVDRSLEPRPGSASGAGPREPAAEEAQREAGEADSGPSQPEVLVGRSAAMRQVYIQIGRVARKPATVLIRGETGTGKELVARAVHQHSRPEGPFVAVNCTAIPESLLESELFGHEAGAFTGAARLRVGRFEQAHGGTLFLDEIGDIAWQTQAKLLRAIDDRRIQRLGGTESVRVDVRLIAATHQNLEHCVEEKRFRVDLYHRLNDAVIHLPPLRERLEDIPLLVSWFLRNERELGGRRRVVPPEVIRLLQNQPWPGNLRQLQNVVYRMASLARTPVLDVDLARAALAESAGAESAPATDLREQVRRLLEEAASMNRSDVRAAVMHWVEEEVYRQGYHLADGDQSRLASWLGVSRPTVRERLRQFGLRCPPGVEGA